MRAIRAALSHDLQKTNRELWVTNWIQRFVKEPKIEWGAAGAVWAPF